MLISHHQSDDHELNVVVVHLHYVVSVHYQNQTSVVYRMHFLYHESVIGIAAVVAVLLVESRADWFAAGLWESVGMRHIKGCIRVYLVHVEDVHRQCIFVLKLKR